MIIGLAGYARSGKNSVGDILAEHHGFEQRAWADKVRAALLALDPKLYRVYEDWGYDNQLEDEVSFDAIEDSNLSELVGDGDWESVKTGCYSGEIRRLLQRMGTEVGREIFGEDFWVDQCLPDPLLAKSRHDFNRDNKIAITDCRFPNELKRVRDLGGMTWWMNRANVGPVNGHASDNTIGPDDCDLIVHNHGTLELLSESVADHLRRECLGEIANEFTEMEL